ncbi:alpha/beta fold hydrolase [Microbacterium sp. cx-59]|uniref:alpha/beta fold hydrolase n=1 Tax=Microbacterium sp. cx-59 TaxID=2891207 RepID=UPI001E535560|nr:alpha/beta hydrolase [Microbacterium sp. cx-59]MCC4906693.1 alpha/beta hydrolase [Microbacterium sp. cx-59]
MPASVVLPRLAWGSPAADRHALLIHGLGSSAALMWRYGTALAEDGWYAVAVDLRGHAQAPRALDYSIAAYAADVAATTSERTNPWDLVIGHSLGGAAAVRASADHPDWTARLILVDPALHLLPADREIVRNSQEAAFADPTPEAVRAQHPRWHPQDIELKATAAQQASVWAVEQTSEQNPQWDERDAAARLAVPTHVLGSDPAVYSIFTGGTAAEVLASNDRITMSIVEKAGHSPHRDRPAATVAALRKALA